MLHVKAKLGGGRIPTRLLRSEVTEGAVELLALEAQARGDAPSKYDALRRAVLEAPRATSVPRERRGEFPRR
jgi:hypothetical protein